VAFGGVATPLGASPGVGDAIVEVVENAL
jgi:hypothetical protein